MASYHICESEVFGDEVVMFCGNYRCSTPSIVEAIQNTEIIIDGIAGVIAHQFTMRIYPRGRFCCGVCGEWKELDKDDHAWAIRSGETSNLVCHSLVCSDCATDEEFHGCRFAALVHQEYFEFVRNEAADALVKRMISKWRRTVQERKNRRHFVMMASLVFKRNLAPNEQHIVMQALLAHA